MSLDSISSIGDTNQRSEKYKAYLGSLIDSKNVKDLKSFVTHSKKIRGIIFN
jgi:hypothetical protein